MEIHSGVFTHAEYIANNPIRRIAREVLDGILNSCSPDEIARLIDERYFSFESFVTLSEEEHALLRNDLIETMNRFFSSDDSFRMFLESTCYMYKKDHRVEIYTEKTRRNFRGSEKLNLMSAQDKIAFLENPNSMNATFHERERNSCQFSRMGYRRFEEYPISYTFSELVKRIQDMTKRNDLHILDLGGGIGMALHDIKKNFPHFTTYNATRDEEFCCYPSDFHIVSFMERMPVVLKGKIDCIISNMATRYFAYTDKVIECCVEMLAPGGIMDVFFSSERSDNQNEEDVSQRMKRSFEFLKDLESSKIIELNIDNTYTSNVGGSFTSNSGSLYPAANVFVQKL